MSNAFGFYSKHLMVKILSGVVIMLLLGIISLTSVYMVVNGQLIDNKVLNDTGKLRMIGQKVTKAAFMVLAGDESAKDELDGTIALFDKTIHSVMNGDPGRELPPAPPEVVAHLQIVDQIWKNFQSNINSLLNQPAEGIVFETTRDVIIEENMKLLSEANAAVQLFEKAAAANSAMLFNVLQLFLGLNVVAFIMVLLVAKKAIAPIKELVIATNRISEGNLDAKVTTSTQDEVGILVNGFNNMINSIVESNENLLEEKRGVEKKIQDALAEREQENKEREILAVVNMRVKEALDKATGNILVADEDLKVIYLNEAVKGLFSETAQEIRKVYSSFDPTNVLGLDIDLIYGGTEVLKSELEALRNSLERDFQLGSRDFRVISNPVLGPKGERLGTVMEWTDRTQAIEVEKEVESIVRHASSGELQKRINLENKSGFNKRLSENVNQLVSVAEGVVNDTIRIFSAMAKGELTETINQDYEGVFGRLKQDANETVYRLTDVMGKIKQTAQKVNSGATDIAKGNSNLSNRTEQQSSSLGNTASSMEEMTSTVKQNAYNASQADDLARMVRKQAEKGGVVVKHAVLAMGEINSSSRKISDIIGVIDEIAFQTNLLALNAAVEAARAGEQGRGFAVVASEVRNLAGRSATAAKEIKDLIEDSSEKVNEGSRLVNESGETLEEIVTGVKKVTDIVGEIASASHEQSAGIDQINKAIAEMDILTQQNASLVEQAATSSQSLGVQANSLNSLVAFFTMKKGRPGSQQASSVLTELAPHEISDYQQTPSPLSDFGSKQVVDEEQDWNEF